MPELASIGARSASVNPAPPGAAIILFLHYSESRLMEAEHINSISNKLDDLAQRAAELRRYL